MSWLTPILRPVEIFSWISLALSSVFHVVMWFAGPPPPRPIFWSLNAGIVVVMAPVTILQHRLAAGAGPFRALRLIFRGCPAWMRRAPIAIWLYWPAVFFLFVARVGESQPGLYSPEVQWLISGMWVCLFFYGAAILRSARWVAVHEPTLKCGAGHGLPPLSQYCPECGRPVMLPQVKDGA